MLIDDVIVSVKAGHGGKGGVAFDKNKMALGPNGGDGGNGGNVYFVGVNNLGALEQFRYQKDLVAKSGLDGRGQFVDGETGPDLISAVPIGTVIHNLANDAKTEIIQVDQKVLVASGGHGGKGNFKFRTSRNTSPRQSQPGLPGQEFKLRLELKLIADVGFVGLPNVGKSSLLNLLTNAKSKVANYPFTTLEPNLGAYHNLILADIPGLIEGASGGKGLGIKFLRHIERTKTLFHFLAADSEDPVADYKSIKQELTAYNKVLAEKPEYLIITKTDMVTPENLATKLKQLKKLNPEVIAISIYDDASLEPLKKLLNKIQREK